MKTAQLYSIYTKLSYSPPDALRYRNLAPIDLHELVLGSKDVIRSIPLKVPSWGPDPGVNWLKHLSGSCFSFSSPFCDSVIGCFWLKWESYCAVIFPCPRASFTFDFLSKNQMFYNTVVHLLHWGFRQESFMSIQELSSHRLWEKWTRLFLVETLSQPTNWPWLRFVLSLLTSHWNQISKVKQQTTLFKKDEMFFSSGKRKWRLICFISYCYTIIPLSCRKLWSFQTKIALMLISA